MGLSRLSNELLSERRGRRIIKHRFSRLVLLITIIFVFCLAAFGLNLLLHGEILKPLSIFQSRFLVLIFLDLLCRKSMRKLKSVSAAIVAIISYYTLNATLFVPLSGIFGIYMFLRFCL